MKVLSFNRDILTLLWILPTSQSESKRFQVRNKIFSSVSLLSVCLAFTASACFAYRYVTTDLENSLYALFQIAAFGCQAYSLVFGFVLRTDFVEMFECLQRIYDERKFPSEL